MYVCEWNYIYVQMRVNTIASYVVLVCVHTYMCVHWCKFGCGCPCICVYILCMIKYVLYLFIYHIHMYIPGGLLSLICCSRRVQYPPNSSFPCLRRPTLSSVQSSHLKQTPSLPYHLMITMATKDTHKVLQLIRHKKKMS